MVVDPRQFWEQKILTWEEGRYGSTLEGRTLLESAANRSSASLRFRMAVAKQLLRPFVAGKHVVEIGCGSGLLAKDILAMGAVNYTGYDIAEAAVIQAKIRARDNHIEDKAYFEVRSVMDLSDLKADIVISLGLIDWLNDDELEILFKSGRSAQYLHAIAEKRPSISQFLHRIYVYLAYGHRTGSYVPRYYTVTELKSRIQRYNPKDVRIFRHSKLSFGTFISDLPIDEQ